MMCQCRFVDCNQCSTLVRAVDHGGGRACVETGDIRKLSELLAPFCYELKLLYKPNSINKKQTKTKTSHNRSPTTISPAWASELLMLHPIHFLNFGFINPKTWTLEARKALRTILLQPHSLTDEESKESSSLFYLFCPRECKGFKR